MRIIAHIDMDAFFAAIEERDHEWLKGKPLVVGADPKEGKGRGVVSTANYAARKYGIHSALPISKAWQLAEAAKKRGEPETVFMGGNMREYARTSARIMEIIRKYAPHVEEASIDEAYADLSHAGSFAKAEKIARDIKAEIKKQERLTASIGIGPNKLIAKIASDMKKPDGLTVITDTEAASFLEPLSARKIPGIGPKTEAQLLKMNIHTIGELRKISKEKMTDLFGSWGEGMWAKARGIDDSPIVEEYEVQSIGEQETFPNDTSDTPYIFDRFKELVKGVHDSFRKKSFSSFRTIVVTVRFADFKTYSRSYTLPRATSSKKTLEFEGMKLLMPFLDARENPRRKKIRLIGIRVEKLS